jgi:EmrB/QacA subfamily drug resistance transporter
MTSTLVARAPAANTTRTEAPRTDASAPKSGLVLGIILTTYLMIILDATIVITALPKIHVALGFSATGLTWVQNAYTLTFGGFLLLGARAGDILGRRRVFVAGIALFTVASLMGGLAQTSSWLLIARAVQGIGAAIAAPSTLALLQISFREGPERAKAIGAYSAVAGAGGSVGLVLGGMLTTWVSWRWGLFINVPIGAALVFLAPRYLPESERSTGHFDLAGAATSTLGMTALVYGFVRAAAAGWGNRVTVASFVAGAALLGAFILTEKRAEQPITPLHLFADRQRLGAYITRVLVVSGMFAMFFFLTQFLQGVDHDSALGAGLAFLPVTAVMFGAARLAPRLAPRVGNTRLLIAGVSTAAVGMAWLSRIGVHTPYFPQIAVPMLLLGLGIGTALTPLTTAGVAGVDPKDAGAASGVVNVAQQLGSSLGLGILVTVFAAASRGATRHPVGSTVAVQAQNELAHAVSTSLRGSAIFLALGLAVVVALMRRPRATESLAVVDIEADFDTEVIPAPTTLAHLAPVATGQGGYPSPAGAMTATSSFMHADSHVSAERFMAPESDATEQRKCS